MTLHEVNCLGDMYPIVAWWDKWRGWHVIVDGRPISNFLAAHKVLEANYLAARAA